jgi:Rrf2 family nitric oxide-sensitive transcriptional repressor
MQLRPETDYALRILLFLASQSQDETDPTFIALNTIASHLGIDEAYREEVVRKLERQGYLLERRGRNGGIRLARQPQEIVLGQVIHEFEGPIHLLECRKYDHTCGIESLARLREVLSWVGREFEGLLGQYTLDQLLPPQRESGNDEGREDHRRAAERPNRRAHLRVVEG